MKKMMIAVCIFACTLNSFAQTQVDLRTQGKDVDFSAATSTRPMKTGSSLPATCNSGELFFLTTAQPGTNVYGCAPANVWNSEGSGSAGSSGGSGGSGGGAVYSVAGKTGTVTLQATDLSDCKMSYLSSTVLLVNSCSFLYPDQAVQSLSAAAITIVGGSGTIYVYASPAGTVNVVENGTLVIACTGCTDAGEGISFPPDVAPLGVWGATITPGNWDPAPVSDQRTLITGPPQIAPDVGIKITLSSATGQKTIGIDPAVVETLADAQAGQELLCSGTGTSASQSCSMMPALTVYTAGMRIHLLSGATNTGAQTLNINNLGAVSILRPDGVTGLASGDVTAGSYYDLTYDGTVFRLQQSASSGGGGGSGPAGPTGATGAAGPIGPTGATGSTGSLTSGGTATGFFDFSSASLRLPEVVYGSLPAVSTVAGRVYVVTDATSAGSCSAGGGSSRAICRSTGSVWEALGGSGSGGGTSLPASAAVLGSNVSSQAVAASAHAIVTPLACADSSGSATAQSCNTSPSFTPAVGDMVVYSTTTANTGSLTINVNGSGAKAVRKWLGSATLAAGDLPANVPLTAVFDGTSWEVQAIGNAPSGGSAAPTYDYKDVPLGVLQGTSGCSLANSFLATPAPTCYLFSGSSTTPQFGRPQFTVGNAIHVSLTLPGDLVANTPLIFRWDWMNPGDTSTSHTVTWGVSEYSCTAPGGVLQPTMSAGSNAAAVAITGNATNTSSATLTLTPSGTGAGSCVGGSTLNFITTLAAATSTDNPVLTTLTLKYYRQVSH